MTSERLNLLLACLVGIGLLFPLLKRIKAAAPGLVVPTWLAGMFGIQLVPLSLIAAFNLSTVPISTTYAPDLAEHAGLVVGVLLLVPATTLASLWLARWLGLLSSRTGERTRDLRLSAAAKALLVAGGIATLAFWPAALPRSGFVGYAARIVHTALLMTPFLAGRYSLGRRALQAFWLAVLGLNAVVGIAVGSRFAALLPIVLFAIGRVSVMAPAARARAIRLAAIGLVPAALFLGVVEAARNEIGRGGIELLGGGGRTSEVVQEVDALASDVAELWRAGMTYGLYRLVNIPNLVVPILSPREIPYRGTGSLLGEVAAYARISALSGQTRGDYLAAGLGTAAANDYGFTVDEFTSVEFGLIADSWSRGGAAVAVAITALLVLLLVLAEQGIVRLFAGDRSLQLVFILVLVKGTILDAASLPAIASVRQMTLDLTVVAALFAAVQMLPRRTRELSLG